MTRAPARQQLQQLLGTGEAARPLIDIGSSTASGWRHPDPFAAHGGTRRTVAHPVQHTRLLDPDDAAAIGSDTVRSGWTFTAPVLDGGGAFVDATGVRWVWSEGQPCLLGHPLEVAGVRGIRRYPHPIWTPEAGTPDGGIPITTSPAATPPAAASPAATALTVTRRAAEAPGPAGRPRDAGRIVVVEPPCPGMLELAMALRNPWQFLHDITDGWQVAGTLLDWSLETLLDAYAAVLSRLPYPPDLIVYPDELGFRAGMYLTVADVRQQLTPRLRLLFARLRDLSGAPILFRCRGAVSPVLLDLARLEPELLQLQRGAAGLGWRHVRTVIPAGTVLHGIVDLPRLGRALAEGDRSIVAAEAQFLARAWPVVAAPVEIVPATVPGTLLARASRFVRALAPGMIRALQSGGDPQRVLAPLLAADAGTARPARTTRPTRPTPAAAPVPATPVPAAAPVPATSGRATGEAGHDEHLDGATIEGRSVDAALDDGNLHQGTAEQPVGALP